MKDKIDALIKELEGLGEKIGPNQWKALQSLRNASLRLADHERPTQNRTDGGGDASVTAAGTSAVTGKGRRPSAL